MTSVTQDEPERYKLQGATLKHFKRMKDPARPKRKDRSSEQLEKIKLRDKLEIF